MKSSGRYISYHLESAEKMSKDAHFYLYASNKSRSPVKYSLFVEDRGVIAARLQILVFGKEINPGVVGEGWVVCLSDATPIRLTP